MDIGPNMANTWPQRAGPGPGPRNRGSAQRAGPLGPGPGPGPRLCGHVLAMFGPISLYLYVALLYFSECMLGVSFCLFLTSSGLRCGEHNVGNFNNCTFIFLWLLVWCFGMFLTSYGLLSPEHNVGNLKKCTLNIIKCMLAKIAKYLWKPYQNSNISMKTLQK